MSDIAGEDSMLKMITHLHTSHSILNRAVQGVPYIHMRFASII